MNGNGRAVPASGFERELLGSLIDTRGLAFDEVLPVLQDAGAFLDPDHRTLWTTLLSFYRENVEFDLPLLEGRLREHGESQRGEQWGLIAYDCWAAAPAPENARRYAELVREPYIRRRLIRACDTIKKRAYTEQLTDPETIGHDAADEIEKILASTSGGESIDAAELIDDLERELTETRSSFVPTQIDAIDCALSGIARGEQWVVAARPSVGKTAFGVTIAYNVSHGDDDGCPVAFFSVEMRRNKIMARLASLLSGVPAFESLNGRASEADRQLALGALRDHVNPERLFVIDRASDVRDIVSRARSLKRRHGVGVVFVDYLQLVEASGKHENRNLAVASMSAALKRLAVDNDLAVICFSQLSRASANEKRPPALQDLRDSGAVEQDADVVAFLHRPNPDDKRRVIFRVAKHRNGPTMDIDLQFDPRVMRFSGGGGETPF